jgi:hypothetical protein
VALRRLIEFALFGVLIAVVVAATATHARAQTPPPTPHPSAPTAPTDIVHFGGRLTWADNSNDEDGFRVRYRFSGPIVDSADTVVDVPADAEEFILPDGHPELCDGVHDAFFFSVAAFNEFGESTPAVGNIVADCGPLPTAPAAASPTADAVTLPRAGAAFEEATSSWHSAYLQTIIVSIAVAALVLVLTVRASRRR